MERNGKMGSEMGGKREILGKMEIMGNKSREKREMGSEMGEKRAIWGKNGKKKGKETKMGKNGRNRGKLLKMGGNGPKWGVFFSPRMGMKRSAAIAPRSCSFPPS